MHGYGNENGICSFINTNKPVLLIKSASCSSGGNSVDLPTGVSAPLALPGLSLRKVPEIPVGTHPSVMDEHKGVVNNQPCWDTQPHQEPYKSPSLCSGGGKSPVIIALPSARPWEANPTLFTKCKWEKGKTRGSGDQARHRWKVCKQLMTGQGLCWSKASKNPKTAFPNPQPEGNLPQFFPGWCKHRHG